MKLVVGASASGLRLTQRAWFEAMRIHIHDKFLDLVLPIRSSHGWQELSDEYLSNV